LGFIVTLEMGASLICPGVMLHVISDNQPNYTMG
jgi:hypothetical protein